MSLSNQMNRNAEQIDGRIILGWLCRIFQSMIKPSTCEETVGLLAISQMKNNKADGLNNMIVGLFAESLQNDGDTMADVVYGFCSKV